MEILLKTIYSFSSTNEWYDDFEKFSGLYNTQAELDKILSLGQVNGIDLYLAWVKGESKGKQQLQMEGIVAARRCVYCGHHGIGIQDAAGNYRELKPGDKIKVGKR